MTLTNFPNGMQFGAVVIDDDTVTIGSTVLGANGVTGGVALPKQAITVAGPTAITLKSGLVLLARTAGAAATTLAAPTAGTDDGKVLHLLATTAQAHTVTVAGGANGGGAAADVGTFGGAIGDCVTLVAYNGVWYVLSNTNVTFA